MNIRDLGTYVVAGALVLGSVGCSGMMPGTTGMRDIEDPRLQKIVKKKADSMDVSPKSSADWMELVDMRKSVGDVEGMIRMAEQTEDVGHYMTIMKKVDDYLERHSDYLEKHQNVLERLDELAK